MIAHIHMEYFVCLVFCERQPCGQEALHRERIARISIGQVLVIWVPGDIVLVRQEGPDAAQLQNALAAVHNRQLVHGHKLFATMSSDEFKN